MRPTPKPSLESVLEKTLAAVRSAAERAAEPAPEPARPDPVEPASTAVFRQLARKALTPHGPSTAPDPVPTSPAASSVASPSAVPPRTREEQPVVQTPAPRVRPASQKPVQAPRRGLEGERAGPRSTRLLKAKEAQGVVFTKGARRLHELLCRLGLDLARARGYEVLPSQIVFFLPSTILADLADYAPRHQRRLVRELEAAGLVLATPHVVDVTELNWFNPETGKQIEAACTGTLWALKLRPDNLSPRLRHEHWAEEYRDFVADRKARRTMETTLSAIHAIASDEEEKYRAVLRLTVAPKEYSTDLNPADLMADIPENSLQDAAQAIADLGGLAPGDLPRAIGALASKLTRALGDHTLTWRKWWCGALWEAVRGGARGLGVLVAGLDRLRGDLAERAPWRNPGAVFARRWRPLP